MGPTREGRVDDDTEAKIDLLRSKLPNDVVRKLVKKRGSGGGKGLEKGLLERESAVTDVVFINERKIKS